MFWYAVGAPGEEVVRMDLLSYRRLAHRAHALNSKSA